MALTGGAGYYTGMFAGRKVEVEFVELAYGDKGWMALVDGEPVTEYPRQTRKEAVAVAVATINAR